MYFLLHLDQVKLSNGINDMKETDNALSFDWVSPRPIVNIRNFSLAFSGYYSTHKNNMAFRTSLGYTPANNKFNVTFQLFSGTVMVFVKFFILYNTALA
jgi:hypothetical protein